MIVFLGILLDTERLEARLPPDKLAQIKKELATWIARTSCTKRELLSLIGLLSFAAKVVPPGRTFLRRMIDTSTSVPTPDDNITLNDDFVKDIQWWHHFLDDWNGKSFFMHPKWIPSTTLNLFTDSSGAIGYGAYFDKSGSKVAGQQIKLTAAFNGKNYSRLCSQLQHGATCGQKCVSRSCATMKR